MNNIVQNIAPSDVRNSGINNCNVGLVLLNLFIIDDQMPTQVMLANERLVSRNIILSALEKLLGEPQFSAKGFGLNQVAGLGGKQLHLVGFEFSPERAPLGSALTEIARVVESVRYPVLVDLTENDLN